MSLTDLHLAEIKQILSTEEIVVGAVNIWANEDRKMEEVAPGYAR